MSFKNAVKLTIAKFSLVWNVLIYTLIVAAFLMVVLVGMWYPTFEVLRSEGYITQLSQALAGFSGGELYLMEAINIFGRVFGEIGSTFLNYPAAIVLTPVLIAVLGRILFGLKDVPVSVCMDAYMSDNRKIGFTEAYFSNFRRSCKLVLSRTLFTLPFDLILMVLIWVTSLLFRAIGIPAFFPFMMIFEWISLISLKKLYFSEWHATIATERNHTFSAMRLGLKLSNRYRGRIYSNWVVTEILGLVLTVLIGILTLGVGLIVFIPLKLTFEQALSMTVLYNHTYRRYYLENGEVFVPEGAPALPDKEDAPQLSVTEETAEQNDFAETAANGGQPSVTTSKPKRTKTK